MYVRVPKALEFLWNIALLFFIAQQPFLSYIPLKSIFLSAARLWFCLFFIVSVPKCWNAYSNWSVGEAKCYIVGANVFL